MFQQLPRLLLILNIVLSLKCVLHYFLKHREALISNLIDFFLGTKLCQSYRLLLKATLSPPLKEND
ncbi:MAG: hypothetical protein LBO09_05020 [Candidatus Peribacteria bacterium]|nr:hypothetical protein [Candidatus Peribacteria bacterium]